MKRKVAYDTLAAALEREARARPEAGITALCKRVGVAHSVTRRTVQNAFVAVRGVEPAEALGRPDLRRQPKCEPDRVVAEFRRQACARPAATVTVLLHETGLALDISLSCAGRQVTRAGLGTPLSIAREARGVPDAQPSTPMPAAPRRGERVPLPLRRIMLFDGTLTPCPLCQAASVTVSQTMTCTVVACHGCRELMVLRGRPSVVALEALAERMLGGPAAQVNYLKERAA